MTDEMADVDRLREIFDRYSFKQPLTYWVAHQGGKVDTGRAQSQTEMQPMRRHGMAGRRPNARDQRRAVRLRRELGGIVTMSEQKPIPVNRRWFYARHWLRSQICRMRGHRLETGHHLSASLYCGRCGRIQFYYHREGKLIVAADATQESLKNLGIRNP